MENSPSLRIGLLQHDYRKEVAMYICFKCQTVLVRYYHPTLEAEDIWVCPECNVPKSEFELVEEYGEGVEFEDEEEIIKTEEDSKYEY